MTEVAAAPELARQSIAIRPGVIIMGGAYGSVAVARSLGRLGIRAWFLGSDHPIARHSRYVERHLQWPGPAAAGALDYLLALATTDQLDGWVLFPSADGDLQFIAHNHAALAARFQLFTAPWPALESLNDKAQLYRLAERIGVDYPRVYADAATLAPDQLNYPVVIKPVSTEQPNALTRAKAWRIDNAAQYRDKAAEAVRLAGRAGFVVQEMIPGDGRTQFSYAALWDRGTEIAAFTARRTRQFPIDFGFTSTFVETVHAPRVAEAAHKLLAAEAFHGLVEVEFKYDTRADSYKVLDVNTRTWAWVSLGTAAGIDFPALAYRLATGEALPHHAPGKVGVSWVHLSRNVLSLLQSLLRRGNFGFGAARSVFKPSMSATFAWDDPMPGLVELPVQVWRTLKRLIARPAIPPPAAGETIKASARE
ncbi:MAG: hypothetical protein JWR75_1143 [Devosia sp.]|nr:hypothetical protein [Devosia sp.]